MNAPPKAIVVGAGLAASMRKDGYLVDTGATGVGDIYSEYLMSADTCILATPVPEALTIYPASKQQLEPFFGELHYVPGICVHLGYSVKTASSAIMVLISTLENPDITLIWLDHNKVSDRAPEGYSLLYLYYDDAVGEQATAKNDATLIAECSNFVEQVFLELRGQQDMTHVSRWSKAVPKPAPGIYTKMREVRSRIDNNRGDRVQLAGDYLSCAGQNTAIVYGDAAARNLIEHHSIEHHSQEANYP